MKAIIYSRVSSQSNGQSNSRQINELRGVKGYQIKKVFQESISGYTKSIDERPELQKALEYIQQENIDAIMIHEISRLGRRTSEVLTLLDQLKSKGVKVYVKSLDLLLNNNGTLESVNRLVVTLLTDLARMESETISYRVKSGLQERKRNGYSIGRQLGSTESTNKFISKHKSVVRYLERGESIRWIATKLKMSPTTVQKVKRVANSN